MEKESGLVFLTSEEYLELVNKSIRLDILADVIKASGYISDDVIKGVLGIDRKGGDK